MKSIPYLALALMLLLPSARTGAEPTNAVPSEKSHFAVPESDEGLPGTGPVRRYPWFRKLWEERRSHWAQQAQQDQHAVVFLGDSITQGWGDDLGGSFPGVKVANRGISGDTTRGVLIRLDEDVLSLHPSAVVLLIGTNDLEENAHPEQIASNLRLIIASLEMNDPTMPIILCQLFPSSEVKKRPPARIKEINQLYAAAVKGDPHVTLVETWPLFANAQGNARIEEFPDLLHPNAIGYAKWAAALRPILATLGFLETQPDPFTAEPGFVSLFNGHDLTGWEYRPTSDKDKEAAASWQKKDPNAPPWPIVTNAVSFDGKVASNDGRFVAKAGRLIVLTPPEFRKIQQLSTARDFSKDFVLKLEFRATPDTDSGIFIRGPQLQCRDYLLAGPYKRLMNYKPQDWNQMVITVKGTNAECVCNGELLEAALKVPPTGPIGLEGDRGQMEYRHIDLKELP